MTANLRMTDFPVEKLRAANRIDDLTLHSGQWNVADDDENQAELDKLLEQFETAEELENAAYDYWNLFGTEEER